MNLHYLATSNYCAVRAQRLLGTTITRNVSYPRAVTINSTMDEFRGFLIQGVTMADGTPVGTFVNLPAQIGDTNVNAHIGACPPEDSSATHMHPDDSTLTNRDSFPYVELYWMSPPAKTGAIQFRYVLQN